MTQYKKGQRVRVSFEGEVTKTFGDSVFHVKVEGWEYDVTVDAKSSMKRKIEILAEPVEVFGPGAVVKANGLKYVYTLLEGGKYFDHINNCVENNSTNYKFTSKEFERLA